MALINNLWVHVVDESWQEAVNSTSHPVESGISFTDTVRREPVELSISGKIVNAGGLKATDIVAKLKKLMNSGSLITYNGTRTASSLQIQDFSISHSNKVWGGCDFDMTLKEVRIAKKSYTVNKTSAKAKTTKTAKIGVGSIVVFKGGSVYSSSDAKKAAATRGRQTCKVTKTSFKSWSTHQYHLVSTDKKYPNNVYGWVDGKNIEGVSTASKTSPSTKSGTQQVSNGSGKAVYHTVKKGDTVWKLTTKTYKELGKSSKWVIDNNPSAFSRKGDARTLQIGKKLLMGYKK